MIGQKLSHYRFVERISEGGMGTVYKAEDFALERIVAIKMIKPTHQDPEIASKRFLREAQAISRIDHPNVVTVHEVVQKGDASFLIMQYVDGESLRDRLGRERLDPPTAIRIAAEMAAGLDAAHQIGVVHRDVKPENVIIEPSGRPKVLDFGVARLVDRSTLTRKGKIIGTLPYMSPEAIKGNPVDARSDVYSLGIVLYEMLSGRVPLDDRDESTLFFKVINVAPDPVSKWVPHLPPEVDRVLAKALAKDPGSRYQSAAEMREALDAARGLLETAPRARATPGWWWIAAWIGGAVLIVTAILLWKILGSR